MQTAVVWFSRDAGTVEMALSIDGAVVAKSASPESIVRELQIRAAREIAIEDRFCTELPTSGKTLEQAGHIAFSEPMSALKLIAACSSMGEFAAFPFPERRAKPRTKVPAGEWLQA